jgi:hypothetical protein
MSILRLPWVAPGPYRHAVRESSAMASWRDQASQEGQSDLDGLLNTLLPFAQQQLDKHGAFLPFGAVVDRDGTVRLTAAQDGREQPAAMDVLDSLHEGARSQRASIRAAAFVADVAVPGKPGDAIRVDVEHADGVAIAVLLPYSTRRLGRGIDYAPRRAAPGERHVWT